MELVKSAATYSGMSDPQVPSLKARWRFVGIRHLLWTNVWARTGHVQQPYPFECYRAFRWREPIDCGEPFHQASTIRVRLLAQATWESNQRVLAKLWGLAKTRTYVLLQNPDFTPVWDLLPRCHETISRS